MDSCTIYQILMAVYGVLLTGCVCAMIRIIWQWHAFFSDVTASRGLMMRVESYDEPSPCKCCICRRKLRFSIPEKPQYTFFEDIK
ncbi:unknown [Singapore grouper iridovirus]|uniref:Uncharacterized protein n=1 Tax=Singapore grouper iridovirus TaxID=262968 RepID=Q5YFE4_9VIRU|nr:hypothetical protein ORF121R [Singapore grouper iridovirus]AAS18136.1 unknown [Singapore grouper iridovirus]WAU86830.1 hypothetical protein ORF121R [Singapore grouper iridovirus]